METSRRRARLLQLVGTVLLVAGLVLGLVAPGAGNVTFVAVTTLPAPVLMWGPGQIAAGALAALGAVLVAAGVGYARGLAHAAGQAGGAPSSR